MLAPLHIHSFNFAFAFAFALHAALETNPEQLELQLSISCLYLGWSDFANPSATFHSVDTCFRYHSSSPDGHPTLSKRSEPKPDGLFNPFVTIALPLNVWDGVYTPSRSKKLFTLGVLPYYLHLLDKAKGVAHFDVSEDRALMLMEEVKKRLPGYLVPKLVREIAGEQYKRNVD